MNNEPTAATPAPAAPRVPDAALATFVATLIVIMLAFPVTRNWLGDQLSAPLAFLGHVARAIWNMLTTTVHQVARLFV
jgi:hypothetical protein